MAFGGASSNPFAIISRVLGPRGQERADLRQRQAARDLQEDARQRVEGDAFVPRDPQTARRIAQEIGHTLSLGVIPQFTPDAQPLERGSITDDAQRERFDALSPLEQRLLEADTPEAVAELLVASPELFAERQPLTTAGKAASDQRHFDTTDAERAAASAIPVSATQDIFTPPTPGAQPSPDSGPFVRTQGPDLAKVVGAGQVAVGARTAPDGTLQPGISVPSIKKQGADESLVAVDPVDGRAREVSAARPKRRKLKEYLWDDAEEQFEPESLAAFAQSVEENGRPDYSLLVDRDVPSIDPPTRANRLALRSQHNKHISKHVERLTAMQPIIAVSQGITKGDPELMDLVEAVTGSKDRRPGRGGRLGATAARDLALIFAFMRSLDPGSVVRESEQETARNARSKLGGMFQYYDQVMSGRALTAAQREDFISTALDMGRASAMSIHKADLEYARVADEEGYGRGALIDTLGDMRGILLPNEENPFEQRGEQPAEAVGGPDEQRAASMDDAVDISTKFEKANGRKPSRTEVLSGLRSIGFNGFESPEQAQLFQKSFPAEESGE